MAMVLLEATSKTLIKLSMEAEAAILQEGLAATETTPRQWPVLVRMPLSFLGSHSRTVSSSDPVSRIGAASSGAGVHVAVHMASSSAFSIITGEVSFTVVVLLVPL